jgi:hypothetical protein
MDGKRSRARIRDEHPDLIFENLISVFWAKNSFIDADPDPGYKTAFSNQLITSCLLCRPAVGMSRTTVGPTCHSQGNVFRLLI